MWPPWASICCPEPFTANVWFLPKTGSRLYAVLDGILRPAEQRPCVGGCGLCGPGWWGSLAPANNEILCVTPFSW